MNISLRLHNNTYAPGIATYGIDGKTGNQGEPGTSMFFTDYDIDFSNQFKSFAEKITSRKLPLSTSETVLDRNYVNGDYFVTREGKVYRLIDIDTLSKNLANGYSEITIDNNPYLELVGIFNKNRGIFNNEDETLYTTQLTLTDDPNNTDNSGLLTINKTNKVNGSTKFISLNAIYGNSANINLDIEYDNTLKAYIIKSQYPVVLDANTFVKYEGNLNQLADYSPVKTSDNNITNFYGICSNIKYDIDASIYSYTYKDSSTIYYGCMYIITLNNETNILENYNKQADTSIMLHYQNGIHLDFLLYRDNESTYYFKQDYDIVKLNEIINRVKNKEIYNIQLSIVDNIECYLKVENNNIVGLL